jgi:hypothetical protein
MSKMVVTKSIFVLCAVALLVGCAGPQPVPYSGLSSASYLKPNPAGPDKIPYAYTTQANWQNYSKVIIDPVVVYQGADNSFGSMSQGDQTELADYMQTSFSQKLVQRFTATNMPEAGTLRIHLTLTGAAQSTPVLSTLMHADIAGNLYNGVQLVRGKPGAMMGSVIYSVEIYDAQSNQLLESYVTKQYANSENIVASFGTLTAAKTGIDKGANALVEQLN